MLVLLTGIFTGYFYKSNEIRKDYGIAFSCWDNYLTNEKGKCNAKITYLNTTIYINSSFNSIQLLTN